MIDFVSEGSSSSSIILFIHGFRGGADTWDDGINSTFPELISEDIEISEKFDVAQFIYFSKLTNLYSKISNTSKLIKKLFGTSHGKLRKNSSIEEISNLLRTEIRFRLDKYDNIIVIAHSMGGLVTKSAIVKDLEEKSLSKIKLFISLAVPHQGANSATFGSLVSSNLQIEGLTPLNEFIHTTNDFWLKTSLRPTTKYFYGANDSVVSQTSAVPADKEVSDVISVDEDHFSITRPENKNATTYLAVKKLILEYQNGDPSVGDFEIQSLPFDDDLNDELFVLKLLSADVHQSSVRDAKEVFLNAEYIRKIFSSASDQKRLAELYKRIKKIYQDSYSKYIHDGIPNSGLLLVDVHEQIMREDKDFLKTLIPFLNAIHKQGMLHQLANKEEESVWWDKSANMDSMKESLKEKGYE
jgi:hypothetical protein